MPRKDARFRISIKDNQSGETLKLELVPSDRMWEERRFYIRVNGKRSTKVETVNLTEVFHRLRRWLVRQV